MIAPREISLLHCKAAIYIYQPLQCLRLYFTTRVIRHREVRLERKRLRYMLVIVIHTRSLRTTQYAKYLTY
jgi:hypothetical protein